MSDVTYPYTILFVEDEKAIRDNYITYLKKYFANIYEADNGESALKVYKEKRPELLIIDINIPKLSGLELLKKIRETDCATRAIMLTAHSDVNTLLQATELNLTKYLVKPITRVQLKEALHMALEEMQNFTITSNTTLSLRGGYLWNFQTNELSLDGTVINFTKTESKFISYIMQNHKQICLNDDIIYEIWDDYDEKKMNSLKSLVHKVRQKLPEDFLENIFGLGYKVNPRNFKKQNI